MKSLSTWTILVAALFFVVAGTALCAQPLEDTQAGALEDFWGNSATWSQQQIDKAAVATSKPETWKILVRFGNVEAWHDVGEIKQLSKSRLKKPKPVTEEMRKAFDIFEASLLVGETRSASGTTLYVVAVLFERGPLPVPSGGSSFALIPLMVTPSSDAAIEFAEAYDDVFDGVIDGLPDSAAAATPPEEQSSLGGVLVPKCPCDEACYVDFDKNKALCTTAEVACSTAATTGFLACVLAAGGVPVLEGLCLTAYIAADIACAANAVSCINEARFEERTCLFMCSSNPPSGSSRPGESLHR